MTKMFERPKLDAEFGDDPIEVAPDIWWVGSRIKDDPFQCHAYLLRRGDQSVLFDPGSTLTWKETRRKIDLLVEFDDIRWFVVHHQDPDICGAMREIEESITRPDAAWVTHWRVAVLLKHYAPKLPFWLIDENDWQLDVDGRKLQFVFTPYLHFPGAFTTFDSSSGTLLSSDIFGGFSSDDRLFTAGLSDFDGVRAFHEHYMPDRNILLNAMIKFELLPIEMIAPQHGKIIVGDDITTYINRLKNLDCGLYLLAHTDTDIHHLQALNNLLHDTIETMASEREFRAIASHIFGQVADVVPLIATDLICRLGDDRALWMSSSDRFRGTAVEVPAGFRDVGESDWSSSDTSAAVSAGLPVTVLEADLVLPLFSASGSEFLGLAVLRMEEGFESTAEFNEILGRIAGPISLAIEREMFDRLLDDERNTMYERSIRDPLTNLFTRRFLDEAARQAVELHRRNQDAGFSILMADIDHFKKVNDTYGHLAGDEILKKIADALISSCRDADIPARFGGEEFVVLMPLTSTTEAAALAERLRSRVENLRPSTDSGRVDVTISLGVAMHRQAETLADTIKKADVSLYEAKESGRNRVCVSTD